MERKVYAKYVGKTLEVSATILDYLEQKNGKDSDIAAGARLMAHSILVDALGFTGREAFDFVSNDFIEEKKTSIDAE
jgi:hypothetical protein